MHEWLSAARDRLADAVGDAPATYELRQEDVDALLEVARVAAHDSGDRTNAPLLTFLVGLALGRHGERTLAEVADRVTGESG
ncbi:MAG: DUF6457 domain-containing protein [Gaiellales bacterium]